MNSVRSVFLAILFFTFSSFVSAQELELIGSYSTPGEAYGIHVSGNYAYVADFYSGLHILDISNPSNPTLAGHVDIPGRAYDVYASGDYAYVCDDTHNNLRIVDVSNPNNPSIVGSFNTGTRVYGVHVVDDYAYLSSGYAGFQILDVSNHTMPVLIGSHDTPGSASGVYIQDSYAYVSDHEYTLHIFDIANSSNPVLLASCVASGYARAGVTVSDGMAYVSTWNTGLQVINVNNPANPFVAGNCNTPGSAFDVAVSGSYAYVTDYGPGLQVIDVSNPSNPVVVDNFQTSGNARSVCVNNEYIFVVDFYSLLILSHNGAGNIALDINDVLGEQGQLVDVPIFAYGLGNQEIAGVELHIAFNDDCLSYTGISSDYMIDPLVNVEGGQIHILWEDYTNPFDLPDSSSLVDIEFTVLGELEDVCGIEWLSNNELVTPSGEVISGINYYNGSVTVVIFSDVGGNIVYYDLIREIADVTVNLAGDVTGSVVTDENGSYLFEVPLPGNYIFCPSRTENDPAVTVSDVVKMRRHIVHLELFDTPYKMIAADVNESGTVSVADIIKVQRYLAELDDLPSGNWAFVDSCFEITDNNWYEAPSCIDTTLEFGDIYSLSFVGIRMGDVDNSWGTDSLTLTFLTDSITVELNDIYGLSGEIISMQVTATGFTDVAGIEFHIEYPMEYLEFIDLSSEVIDDLTYNGGAGEVHLIWEDIFDPITLDGCDEIISIDFEILENVPDSIPVSFLNSYVVDEYGDDFIVRSIDGYVIESQTSTPDKDNLLPGKFILIQNYPNPFNSATTIRYNLPFENYVTLEIYDLLGRKIKTLISENQFAGYHNAIWDSADNPSGVYFYKIKANNTILTRKMTLIK